MIALGDYKFFDRSKFRRAQTQAGEGADVQKVLNEYLKLGGLVKNLKGEVIELEEEEEQEEEKEEFGATYFCEECQHKHRTDSGIGKKHRQYAK